MSSYTFECIINTLTISGQLAQYWAKRPASTIQLQGGSCLIKSWVLIIQGRIYYTSGSWSWLYCWTSFRCNLRLLPLKLRSSPCLDLGCTTNWISGTYFLHSSWFFVKIFVQVVVEQVILPELAKVKYSKFLLKRFHRKCLPRHSSFFSEHYLDHQATS